MTSNTKSKFIQDLLSISENVFASSVDILLWTTVYFAAMSVPQSTYGQIRRANISADKFLDKINYRSIKELIRYAKRSGLVKKGYKRNTMPEISIAGKVRLSSLVPQYDDKRVWDNRIYLVTYDVPENRKNERNCLRLFLIRIGCGMLQDSVWTTPYDPTDIIGEFIEKNNLKGTVLVSNIGKDGSLGDEDIKSLIVKVYHLDDLNNRYKLLLKNDKNIDISFVMRYLSILHDDPQLPFPLLPSWWVGGKVYLKVKSILKMVQSKML
jgi:DNA-binding transcriptional regulator PaaX